MSALFEQAPPEKPQVSARDALEVARKFVRFLKPRCEQIVVAGSLRRRRPLVRDIELLFIPNFERVTDKGDLFGQQTAVSSVDLALEALLELGLLAKRPKSDGTLTWGPENKLGVHVASGIPVDLFTTTREKWFNSLVVRTGPKESNQRLAAAALERGWHWHAYGSGFSRELGSRTEHRPVLSEADAFMFVGLPHLEPNER